MLYSKGLYSSPVARNNACQTAWHIRELTSVAVCGVVPVSLALTLTGNGDTTVVRDHHGRKYTSDGNALGIQWYTVVAPQLKSLVTRRNVLAPLYNPYCTAARLAVMVGGSKHCWGSPADTLLGLVAEI